MDAKQASNIGRRSVKHPVISVTKMMPVTGARTTAVKNAAIPTTTKAAGVQPGKGTSGRRVCSQDKTALSSQDEHGRKQSARRLCRVGDRPKAVPDQEYKADNHHAVAAGERALRDRVAATDQSGPKPCEQPDRCACQRRTHIDGPPAPESLRGRERAEERAWTRSSGS